MTPTTMPDSGGETMAVIVERLKNIQASITRLDTNITNVHDKYVPRAEWDVWATARDREIIQLRGIVTDLTNVIADDRKSREQERNARHVPWTAIGAFFVGGASLLLNLIP